jgi:uncharacterized protein (DUF302 family)
MVDRQDDSEPIGDAFRNEIVTRLSPWSVTDTAARLSAIAAARGMKLFAEIDHSGEARATGLNLRDTTLVIFGDPETETPIMEVAPEAGLDLPLRVLVWSEAHQTKVSYVAPTTLAARYGLSSELESKLEVIRMVVDNVIDG